MFLSSSTPILYPHLLSLTQTYSLSLSPVALSLSLPLFPISLPLSFPPTPFFPYLYMSFHEQVQLTMKLTGSEPNHFSLIRFIYDESHLAVIPGHSISQVGYWYSHSPFKKCPVLKDLQILGHLSGAFLCPPPC